MTNFNFWLNWTFFLNYYPCCFLEVNDFLSRSNLFCSSPRTTPKLFPKYFLYQVIRFFMFSPTLRQSKKQSFFVIVIMHWCLTKNYIFFPKLKSWANPLIWQSAPQEALTSLVTVFWFLLNRWYLTLRALVTYFFCSNPSVLSRFSYFEYLVFRIRQLYEDFFF